MSEEDKEYINLKVAYKQSKGEIEKSPDVYRKKLVLLAVAGGMDKSDYNQLKGWKESMQKKEREDSLRGKQMEKEKRIVKIIVNYKESNELSFNDLCDMVFKEGKGIPGVEREKCEKIIKEYICPDIAEKYIFDYYMASGMKNAKKIVESLMDN